MRYIAEEILPALNIRTVTLGLFGGAALVALTVLLVIGF